MGCQVAGDVQMPIAASHKLDDLFPRYVLQIVPFLSSENHNKPATVL